MVRSASCAQTDYNGTQGGTQGGTQDDDLDKWIEYQVAVYPKITTEELASLS